MKHQQHHSEEARGHAHGAMKKEPIGRWLVLMVVLGALALWGFGALVESRLGRAVPAPAGRLSGDGGGGLSALRTGLTNRLDHAREALGAGRSTQAAVDLDAAKRLARVGAETAGAPFDDAMARIQEARKSLQKGRAVQARAAIGQIELGAAAPGGDAAGGSRGHEYAPGHYRGATVINAQGVRVGEVGGVENGEARLHLGGQNDALGFIDLPDTVVAVPVDRLLWGKPQAWGSTLVVLPSFATEPRAMVAAAETTARAGE